MTITLFAETGEAYSYVISALSAEWKDYRISFADMTLADGYFGSPELLSAVSVVGVSLSIEYDFYKTVLGVKVPQPKYVSDNFVYIDHLRLIKANEGSAE